MARRNPGISPELIIHPGETISDVLEDRGITQKELAQRAGVSEAFLSDVIHGKKDISKSLAMGLEYALGVPSSFWLNLQANYDAEILALNEEETIQQDEREAFSTIHEIVDYLKRTVFQPMDISDDQMILGLRKYFKISNLADLKTLAPTGAFRMSSSATIDPTILGAWLCLCKVQGSQRHLATGFDPQKIDNLVSGIKVIMNGRGDPQRSLTLLFAQYGIDFSVVKNFRGAPVHGYIARKDDGSYQMVLTIRGAYADIFWFSLFHELGHIVNGDVSKPGSFIDADYSKDDIREKAADQFASTRLLEPLSYQQFVERGSFSYPSIRSYAQSQGVPPYVVIGRLQREKHIPYQWHAKYKLRYKWAEA